MAIELSAILSEKNRFSEWASKVTYKSTNLDDKDKEISKTVDAWVKSLGSTGDPAQEIAQLVRKTITLDTVEAPSALIDRMFNTDSIGEFDDVYGEVDPKNTIQVYEGGRGGNVDRSFIDHKVLRPSWTTLIAETDVSLKALRSGGYKTVAKLINDINEALEMKKISLIFNKIDAAKTVGSAGCIQETSTLPTAVSGDMLAEYLLDVTTGETPVMFGVNKYIQALSKLAGGTSYGSDAMKERYNQTGFLANYAGCELLGFSGQRKLPNGSLVVPDKRVFGVAGKIGDCITRGSSNVFQSTDIDSEKIHIKVSGYEFGVMFTDLSKVGKIIVEYTA